MSIAIECDEHPDSETTGDEYKGDAVVRCVDCDSILWREI